MLDELEPRVQDTSLQAESLYSQAETGSGYISPGQAVQRFQDMLYLNMIGEHEVAAEGFFALVTSAALTEEGLHRDAEWYLAESLFQMGNLETAETRFQVVANDGAHPFRDDAVRRLLEIYAVSGELDRFRELYDAEIETGRVEASDLITYSVAKNFYIQKDLAQARSGFAAIPATSPYYGKARYFLGTISVIEGDLQGALPLFDEVAGLSVDSTDARKVHDQALLALGRIHYELEDYLKAAEYYSRISADSEYAADKLYEITWTFIRTEAWQDALRGIDIFLIAFPEHENAARLKVVKGKLHMAESEYDNALTTFEEVVTDYSPVRDRFEELVEGGTSANRAYFDEVLEIARSETGTSRLPPYAVAMILADPDLSRAISVFAELEAQERTVRASESMIRELKGALAHSPTIGAYQKLRYDAMTTSFVTLEQQLALLAVEEDWQRSAIPAGRMGTLDLLAERRQALGLRVAELAERTEALRAEIAENELTVRRLQREAMAIREDAAAHAKQLADVKRQIGSQDEMDPSTRGSVLDELTELQEAMNSALGEAETIEARITRLQSGPGSVYDEPALTDEGLKILEDLDKLRLDYTQNREARTGDLALAKRFDSLYLALARTQERLQGVQTTIEGVERAGIESIQKRFEDEAHDVMHQRDDLVRLLAEAEMVSSQLTKEGFGRLEDFFARSVLDADMGIVDVYWSQKLEIADEITRVKEERQALLSDLEQRFTLIKQKIGN